MTHHTTPTPQPERRAKPRTCDVLGTCKAPGAHQARRTTPCTGCTPATTLHRVHLPMCTANQCKQGHQPCPTPQACQLPDCTDEAPATSMEMTGFVLAVVAVVLAIGSALFSCASA